MRNAAPLRRLTLTELLLRMSDKVPPFHGNPNSMTLSTYAQALWKAMVSSGKLIGFVLACMIKLGFAELVRTLIADSKISSGLDSKALRDLEEAAETVTRTGEHVLLVLNDKEPPTRSSTTPGQAADVAAHMWTISMKHSVLPTFAREQWISSLKGKIQFSLVLVEESMRDQVDGWTTSGLLPYDTRIVSMVKSRDRRIDPLVVDPKDLDDAVAQALRRDVSN